LRPLSRLRFRASGKCSASGTSGLAHPRLGPGRYHLRLVEFLFCDGGGQTGSMSVSISLVRSRPPERLRPPAGLSSPSRPCPSRTAAPHPWCRRTRPQGSSSRTRTWRKTLTFFFLILCPSPAAALGPRSASRPPLPMPPCPTRYAAPPAGATTSSLDLALPAPHAPAHPAAACLPRALLPLLLCSPCHAALLPCPCSPCALPCLAW